jgi:LPXTG-motif cell wall-anchored protein
MKTFLSLVAAVAISASVCQQASATIVTSVVAGPNSPGITFGAASFNHVVADNAGTPGPSANTITLNATFEAGYVPNSPFNWTINFVEADGDLNVNGNAKYLVTLNLLNNGAEPAALASQLVSLGAPNILLDVFPVSVAGPNSFVSPSSPGATSSIGTSFGNGFNAGTPFVGFHNAGAFNVGDAATLVFTLDLADYSNGLGTSVVSGDFVLSMVANPEPASLALAGFALSASGAGVFIRRKKKVVATVVEQTPAV